MVCRLKNLQKSSANHEEKQRSFLAAAYYTQLTKFANTLKEKPLRSVPGCTRQELAPYLQKLAKPLDQIGRVALLLQCLPVLWFSAAAVPNLPICSANQEVVILNLCRLRRYDGSRQTFAVI